MNFDLKQLNLESLKSLDKEKIIDFLKNVDKKTWIKIGISAAVALLFIIIIVWPAWITRIEVHNKIRALEGQILTTQALFNKKPMLVRNKQEYSAYSTSAKKRIYPPGESSLLLGVISKMAEDTKVAIVASKPKAFEATFPPTFKQQYEGSAYDFTVEGGYHDLAKFISRIESNTKLLRVELFHVIPREETPKSHLADISFSAVSFKQQPKTSAAA